MLAKKIRTEYMKKFRDPKWETFSKCYEDSLKYRLTRRVMEHAHKPWFWEGWDTGSDSSGRSTPKTRNKVSPLVVHCPTLYDSKNERSSPEQRDISELKPPFENGEAELDLRDALPPSENALLESDEGPVNRVNHGPSDQTQTDDDGPANQVSSPDDEPARTHAKHRRRHRASRSEPGRGDVPHDDKQMPVRKPARAKSQPPASAKHSRQPPARCDWSERHVEASTRRTPNEGRVSYAVAQTRRESDKRGGANPDRRRARSADLEKMQRSELTVAVDDRWITEYMRCFSARLR